MKLIETVELSSADRAILKEAMLQIDKLNSSRSVKIMEDLFNSSEKHPEIYSHYAFCLYKNGKWMESIAVIDEGIETFGPNYFLVYTRLIMSWYMAQQGTKSKNIDGNTLYQANPKDLPYEEDQFFHENNLSALNDALYLYDVYEPEPQLINTIALIYRDLQYYEDSNIFFSDLSEFEGFSLVSDYQIGANFIAMQKYEEAEHIFLQILENHPEETFVYEMLTQIYSESGNENKAADCAKKARFYNFFPDFLYQEYDENLYTDLTFLIEENDSEEKLQKLKEISNDSQDILLDVSLVILYTHTNHGNGLEEYIRDKLIEIGEESIPKLIELFLGVWNINLYNV
ncbi:MAG: hypothetical protein JXB49_05735 [Bacteroidales bacterium]|nr:hypothetical protein [Bacteroidales bacterium]